MDAESVVIGYAMGYNDGLDDGGGEKPSDDWQPPENWIAVPEPEPYDIYVLILATSGGYGNTGMKFELMLGRESDNEIGHGNIFVDWGDGTTDQLNQRGYPTHTYTEEGQYLIHIITDENANAWRSSSQNQATWQIVKTGENIAFVTDRNEQNNYPYSNVFPNKNYIKYVQINHPKGLPKINYLFQSCYALKKIDVKKKFSGDIPQYAFAYCTGLSDFSSILDSDGITSVGNSAFYSCYGLIKIYLPNCTSTGNGAFSYCYNLQEIVVAEDCTFGTNCFQNCYSLYPRPDGSTN